MSTSARYSGGTGCSSVPSAASAASSRAHGCLGPGEIAAPAGELGLDHRQVHAEDAPSVCRRRRGEAPSDAQMGGGLVEQAVEDVVDRERRREISVAQMGIGREQREQRVERVAPAGHRQGEVAVREQAPGRRPITGCLVVPDGLGHVSVHLVPRGRRAVQRRNGRRRRAPQLQAQQIGEQAVVAKPGPGAVECGDEGVLVLELLEDRLGPGAAGEGIGQRPADALEDRGAQEQVAHLRRLALEHLGEEVARHGALAARELGHEPLWVRVRAQRDRRQTHTGRPSLRAFLQRRDGGVRHADPARTEQAARLVEREAQVGPAQLGQLARDPQPMQAERRLLASREQDPQLCRHPREQQLQPGQRVLGAELVEIVDHQLERLLEPLELGQQPLDDRRAGEARRRTDPLDDLVAGRIGERVDQGEPEPLRVALAALDRDPGDGLIRLGRP